MPKIKELSLDDAENLHDAIFKTRNAILQERASEHIPYDYTYYDIENGLEIFALKLGPQIEGLINQVEKPGYCTCKQGVQYGRGYGHLVFETANRSQVLTSLNKVIDSLADHIQSLNTKNTHKI